MPAFEEMDLLQYAILWEHTGKYDRHGQPTVNSYPVEIQVDWQVNQREGMDKQGNVITLEGSARVGREIRIGSVMWLGRLADLPASNRVPNDELVQVTSYKESWDIKLQNAAREVTFMRLRDSLPTLV